MRDTRATWSAWALLMFVHALPRLVLGDRSIVIVHDNLDSDFLYRVLIARPGRLFDYHAQIPELLGGLPRSVYPSALKLSSVLFAALPTFWAYVALDLCVRSIAFAGMHLLIRDHLPARPQLAHRLLIAATYASLPFYVIYDASVAAQALVAWSLLNLWRTQRVAVSLLLLTLFPFVSVLPTSGAFVIATAGLCTGVAALWTRRVPWWLIAGTAAMLLGYIVSDYWFIHTMAHPPYVSHRSVWMQTGSEKILDIKQVLSRGWQTFLIGRYHSPSLHSLILFATVATAGVSLLRRRTQHLRWMIAILLVSALLSFSERIGMWQGLAPIWEIIPFTRMVHVRVHWFLPTFWFAALAVITGIWATAGKRVYWVWLALLLNLAWVVKSGAEGNGELLPSYQAMLTSGKPVELSYREFVAERLFARIDAAIGKPKSSYRVVSIGLHPGVAVLNGFYTADGYHDNYPLAYKQRFEKLISGQLARDQRMRKTFDDWGSRAYVFVPGKDALDMNQRQASQHHVLKRLSLDAAALQDLGVKYIFSAYELRGRARASYLRPLGEFTDPEAAWRVYVYGVVLGT